MKVFETTTCAFCGGLYFKNGACPKYGLKFQNSHCKEVVVKYQEIKIRNDVPWWKFWKGHYNIEKIIVR